MSIVGTKIKNARLEIIRLSDKYTPTNGCANCHGDLYQGCDTTCKEEFYKAGEFVRELYNLVRIKLQN